MNIYSAKQRINDLDLRSTNKTLFSKLGNKTNYCKDLMCILDTCNIPYDLTNLVETKWRVNHNDFSAKFCKNCNANVSFVSLYKGFNEFCNKQCSAKFRDNSTRKGWVTESGWQKSRETLKSIYGVDHQFHVPEIFERQQNNRYKTYTIESPSHVKYRVQGYERFVIPELWKTYPENDVIVSKREVPKIEYTTDGKNKRYYPDSYIISTNTIVEVKSSYTIKNKNLIDKLEACSKAGFDVKVYLYHDCNIYIMNINDVKLYLNNVLDLQR